MTIFHFKCTECDGMIYADTVDVGGTAVCQDCDQLVMIPPRTFDCECRFCGAHLEAEAHERGNTVPCPSCGKIIVLGKKKKAKSALVTREQSRPAQRARSIMAQRTDSGDLNIQVNVHPDSQGPTYEGVRPSANYTQAINAKGEGASIGFFSGLMIGILTIPFGCCFFSLIPGFAEMPGLMLAGWVALAAIIGMGTGLMYLKGLCPYCGAELTVWGGKDGKHCKACKNRVVVRNERFYTV